MTTNLLSKTSIVENALKNFLAEKIHKDCPHVPIEDKISAADFKNKYVNANKPVILRGMLQNWPAFKKWNLDFFANDFNNVEIDVNLYDAKKIKKSNFAKLKEEINSANIDNPVYLQEWWFHNSCPDLLKDIIVPEYFSDDYNLKLFGFYNSTLWMGSKGAMTTVHQDSVYANIWTAQIRGKKEWILFDKNAVLKSKADGSPDYDEFLANKDNHVSSVILQAGDILYVPYKWWHRAFTCEDAISLNTFYITEEIARRFIGNVLAIPFAMSLNPELVKKNDPMRYNICMARINNLCDLLGYNKENVLGIKVKE